MVKLFVCNLLLLFASVAYASPIEANSFLVSVQGTGGDVICVGALISEDIVVTTAQCLAFYDVSQLVVAVNNRDVEIPIAASGFDAKFDFVTMEDNVAVLKLAKPVKADYIQLAQEQPATGANGVVYSWGEGNSVVNVPVSLISQDECASGKYGYDDDEVLDTMLCGLVENSQSCVGRFGSPVVSGNKLVGLTSWGGCGNNGKPAVFTDIPSLRPWIDQFIKSLN
uniref:Trypsin n=1 Tax=Ceratitis capitata TaxID=7213 RepID=W8C4K5_CERCA